jgi:hypothetical protein
MKAHVIAAAAFVFATTAVSANAQVSPADATCRTAIQKNMGKLGKTTMKTIDTCLKKATLDASPSNPCALTDADSFSGDKIT